MINGVEVVFGREGFKKVRVEYVSGHDTVTFCPDRFIERDNIHSNDMDAAFFGKIVNKSMPDFSVCARNENCSYRHRVSKNIMFVFSVPRPV